MRVRTLSLAFGLALSLIGANAQAQSFPNRTITIVVPAHARWYDRRHRATPRRKAHRLDGPVGRGREQAGRLEQSWHRLRRQGSAGWLYAGDLRLQPRHQQVPVQVDAVRSGGGLRAGGVYPYRAIAAGRAPVGSGQDRSGADRLDQREPRQGLVRDQRQRDLAAHGGRAVQEHGQDRNDAARTVSRQLGGASGPARWPDIR